MARMINRFQKPGVSSMSCCLADGQGVPETPEAARVAAIPVHHTIGELSQKMETCTWPDCLCSRSSLRLVLDHACSDTLWSRPVYGMGVEEHELLTKFHLKIFTADSILVATHPFSDLSEWLAWLTSSCLREPLFSSFLFIVRRCVWDGP